MFVTNWISTTKIQKISEITNFFRHYFLSRTEVNNDMLDKMNRLFATFPEVDMAALGFPSGWENEPLWQ